MKRVLSVMLFLSGCCGNADVLCLGSLNVRFSRPVSFPYHVEVRSMQGVIRTNADCEQPVVGCGINSVTVSGSGVHEEPVVIRVSERTLVSVDTVAPSYETVRSCPECLNGEATVRLVAAQ